MAQFGWPEFLIIAVIVILIFGVGKVADVGPALGKAISGFRQAVKEGEEEEENEAEPTEKEA
ncbi:MAG: twin-arginine translocase TatA/TatE family subunit [Anaerolineae bacterium]|jgi:sec-independent protein translocase protein TatA